MNANAISVSAQTHELLKLMARHEKRPIAELVETAVERYRRDLSLADGLSPR